jgi:hypothetical protein
VKNLKKWLTANEKLCIVFLFLFVSFDFGYGQEALLSHTEQYYDFLALQGLTTRPTLNYRTLSDSVWSLDEDAGLWQGQNLGAARSFSDGRLKIKIYGPELFASENTAAPYGQNDGALWQGKGFNASLTGGIRLEAYGLELTLKPQLAFSQNAAFDYIRPAYSGDAFEGKASVYGYYGLKHIDAPQRFGNEPFFAGDWGDSEIRYSWKTLTAGFGTQPIWLGPAQINPILHSNNAPSYPKLDLGIRKQAITIPGFNWYIGDIEARAWWGYLSESDFFDTDPSNDHNLITGLAIAYGVPFLPGLTIGLNRTMLSKWAAIDYESILTLLWPFMENSAGGDRRDQRASVVLDYVLPAAGINVYLEWARNDHSPNFDYVLRYPFHSIGYTAGIKKAIAINDYLSGELVLEITGLEASQDYDRAIWFSSTFYSHHITTQGYSNRGQWLGAGIGTGGNSQYLGFKLYFPKGYGQIFLQRRNPDLDYTWFVDSKQYPDRYKDENVAEGNIRLFLDAGLSGLYYLTNNLSVSGCFVFRDERNPLNKSKSMRDHGSVHRYNAYFSAMVKYTF